MSLSPGRSLLPRHLLKRAMSRRNIHPDLFTGRIVQTTDLQTTLQSENILPINLEPGLNSVISIGGIVVNALAANIAVGIITNPANAVDLRLIVIGRKAYS